ncbi:MAG: Flp family type IVb pilin [Candidatus Obscuribacterales bacterium]
MTKRNRNKRGQSMVEYAIGIGAVAALCMVALGSLGHICGDMIHSVENAINYGGTKSADPGRTINPSATPWVLD